MKTFCKIGSIVVLTLWAIVFLCAMNAPAKSATHYRVTIHHIDGTVETFNVADRTFTSGGIFILTNPDDTRTCVTGDVKVEELP